MARKNQHYVHDFNLRDNFILDAHIMGQAATVAGGQCSAPDRTPPSPDPAAPWSLSAPSSWHMFHPEIET